MTHVVELSAGPIEYEDSGGDGPVVVLLPGLMMDATLWTAVVEDLARDHRCVVPTLPLGAHRRPMHADADLSLRGVAGLVGELLARLGLDGVTLVGSDTGGALVQVLAAEGAPRAARIALVSCEAFDNVPPGLTGRAVTLSGKLPPALFGLFMQQTRLRAMRRTPIAFGWLTKRGDPTTAGWMRPILRRQEIRRDAVRVLRSLGAEPGLLERVAEQLRSFDRPALVVWASEDRVMPPEHGRRLAQLLPHGRLVEVADSYTLVSLDQPARLARELRAFVRETAPA